MAVDADATPGVVRGARRAAIIAVVVSLVIAAAIGIVALVSGDFGELQGRIILSTLTVAAFGTAGSELAAAGDYRARHVARLGNMPGSPHG